MMSTENNSRISREKIERAIDQIDGVQASQVVLGPNQDIQEIHLLGTNSRSAKQVVRDVESLLILSFGLRCDYRKISLVQIDASKVYQDVARPKLMSVEMVDLAEGQEVIVKIQAGESVYTSRAAVDQNSEPLYSVATATVGAVQQILDKNVTLSLDEVKAIQLAKRDVVIVCITALTMASEQTYLGASFVRNKLHDAVVRATLDAINRRLSALQTA